MANRYSKLIEAIFFAHFRKGLRTFPFERQELVHAAKALNIQLPKNLGDIIYSFRYRNAFSPRILSTCSKDESWVIEGAGRGSYRFRLAKETWIVPRKDLVHTLIPDATPQIIERYAMTDEQAVLAKVRYNRLIDIFTGIVCYSLQNHLRTTVKEVGQIEVDELYVGVNRKGEQFIIPIQAKTSKDKVGIVQVAQDVAFCRERFPKLACKPVAVQFTAGDVIAMFELSIENDDLRIVEERHYRLVPSDDQEVDDQT